MPREIQLRNERTGYYLGKNAIILDPNEVARRLVKVISLHDRVKNIDKITLNATWHELGIDELTYTEIMLGNLLQNLFIFFRG